MRPQLRWDIKLLVGGEARPPTEVLDDVGVVDSKQWLLEILEMNVSVISHSKRRFSHQRLL